MGVQCVDCVAAAARARPVARTAFGGRVTDGRPVVTYTIMGLCAAAYLLQRTGGGLVEALFAFYPSLAAAQPWRFITTAFLHSSGNILHIAFNLYALFLTGPYLEQVLGRARFAALYLVAALGGSVGYLLLTPVGAPGTVGASGAVFGLFGALLVIQRRMGRRSSQIVGVLVVNGVLGFVPGLNIAWQAHLGGFVTGVALAAVLVGAPHRRRAGGASRRTAVQAAGITGIVLVLVVAAALRVALVGV